MGFLLGGVGELNKNRQPNFMVVDKNTAVSDIEETLKGFIRRSDIDIILINQNVAEMVGLTRYFLYKFSLYHQRFITLLLREYSRDFITWPM